MGAPRFHSREGAANRIHREHPQAMRSQRFVPPTYTMDATGWDDPRNDIVPLWMLERNDREAADRRFGLACIAALFIIGVPVNLWLWGPAIERAVRYAVGMLV